MTFGDLAVGEQFVIAEEGITAAAYQKKSKTSAYALYGDKDGGLVNAVKSDVRPFTKKAPVIKLTV